MPESILVVEDDVQLAAELAERLGELGYAVIGPAPTIAEAECLIAMTCPNAALLDGNVAGLSSASLARKLASLGVPLAFCTGDDKIKGLSTELAKAPVLTKPVSDATLAATLRALLT